MAVMDLAGKAWGVPCVADARRQVPRSRAALHRHDRGARPEGAGSSPLEAHMDRGITYLKQDFGMGSCTEMPGMLSPCLPVR